MIYRDNNTGCHTSALIVITPAAGSGISSSYCRPAFISNCCVHPLEQHAS